MFPARNVHIPYIIIFLCVCVCGKMTACWLSVWFSSEDSLKVKSVFHDKFQREQESEMIAHLTDWRKLTRTDRLFVITAELKETISIHVANA